MTNPNFGFREPPKNSPGLKKPIPSEAEKPMMEEKKLQEYVSFVNRISLNPKRIRMTDPIEKQKLFDDVDLGKEC